MVLAELNAFVSRPIAPTRRIAMGEMTLPCRPAPGSGGLLLGAIAATFVPYLDDESRMDLIRLMTQVEKGHHIAQPRLRHRFQTDHVGLQRISYRLTSEGDKLGFHFQSEKATPTQHVLIAVYAVGSLSGEIRGPVMAVIRRAMTFPGGNDADLVRYLTGSARSGAHALSDPVVWALEVLDLEVVEDARENATSVASSSQIPVALPPAAVRLPSRSEVQRAFRRQLRHSHPDHGGERISAAQRIADLAEARRILLDR